MRNIVSIVSFGLVFCYAIAAAAMPALPSKFELRQLVQQDSIDDAERDGRVAADRAKELNAEQDAIAALEAEYRADGQFTDREVTVLTYRLDLASRHIDVALRTPAEVAQR